VSGSVNYFPGKKKKLRLSANCLQQLLRLQCCKVAVCCSTCRYGVRTRLAVASSKSCRKRSVDAKHKHTKQIIIIMDIYIRQTCSPFAVADLWFLRKNRSRINTGRADGKSTLVPVAPLAYDFGFYRFSAAIGSRSTDSPAVLSTLIVKLYNI